MRGSWRTAAVLCLFALAGRSSAAPAPTLAFDLRDEPHVVLTHPRPDYMHPRGVGDVNGDGHLDVAVGACGARRSGGVVHVVFGPLKKRGGPIADQPGFSFFGPMGERDTDGATYGDHACWVRGGGDINDDGRDDILIGAPDTYPADGSSGAVYVVFGKTDEADLYAEDFLLGMQGTSGYHTFGGGYDVHGLGDVNGDGFDDFLTRSYFSPAYVVFGQPTPTPVDLGTLDSTGRGYKIHLPRVFGSGDFGVASAGDVNGDGAGDVAIWIWYRQWKRRDSFVVFGKADPLAVDVRDLGAGGFTLKWPNFSPRNIAGLGDVNDDGYDDIGILEANPVPAHLVVLFGRSGSGRLPLSGLEKRGEGFVVRGPDAYVGFGDDLAALGDVDRDGNGDFAIGAMWTKVDADHRPGSVYVIFGNRGGRTLDATRLGRKGYRIDGPGHGGQFGGGLGGTGDLDRDGSADLIISAPGLRRTFISWGRSLK